jgi:hypothetical protein
MVTVPRFDWDAGNRDKCTKHGVAIDDIESVFRTPLIVVPDPDHSRSEPRFRAIGRTDGGRHVFVVFALRRRGSAERIRPISARYMHRKEVTAYEKANPILQEDPDVQDR